jgi:Rps23 Pro-64 3,4-dihydroxylase Tpa1-like proline 4-hydroxylase
MGDFFCSLYQEDDFLSPHTDTYGGTWATVLYLSEGPTHGGTLSFFCRATNSWCKVIKPGSNRLVLFKTRHPDGPYHRVDRVTKGDGFYRWGGTGWYDEVDDELSPFEASEREKMRSPTMDYRTD